LKFPIFLKSQGQRKGRDRSSSYPEAKESGNRRRKIKMPEKTKTEIQEEKEWSSRKDITPSSAEENEK